MDLSSQDDVPTCRICHCTESPGSGLVKLISPCHCSGSLKYVHHSCLQQWLDATNSQRCELCKHPFSMSVKYKPLYKWGALNASPCERRRLICNSVFNLVSMVCIFWSIYVLIERAAFDARNGQIDWSFYVKISVATIGLIIGVIFLFVQLKLYISIFMRWRQSNRIIVISNANFANENNNDNNNSGGNSDRNNNTSTTSLTVRGGGLVGIGTSRAPQNTTDYTCENRNRLMSDEMHASTTDMKCLDSKRHADEHIIQMAESVPSALAEHARPTCNTAESQTDMTAAKTDSCVLIAKQQPLTTESKPTSHSDNITFKDASHRSQQSCNAELA